MSDADLALSTAPAFVTGAGGFLGRHLVAALLDRGRGVTALVHRRPLGISHPRLVELAGDVTEPAAYAAAIVRGATVFHLAARRAGVAVRTDELRRTNVLGTRRLGEAAGTAGAGRFVHVSTAWCHGAAADGRRRSESDPPDDAARADAYVASRLEARAAIGELAAAGLPAVVAAPTVVFGPERPGSRNRVTREIARLLRRRVVLTIAGGGARRTLAFVDDVVDGLLRVEAAGRLGEEYLLGGEDVSHHRLARSALAAAGTRPRLALALPAGPLRAAAALADRLRRHDPGSGWRGRLDALGREWIYTSERAERELGYRPTPFDRALARTVAALSANPGETGTR